MKWKSMFQESDQYAVKAERGWNWLDLPHITKSAFHSCFLWNFGWTVKKRKKKKEATPARVRGAPVEVIQITEVIPYVTDS